MARVVWLVIVGSLAVAGCDDNGRSNEPRAERSPTPAASQPAARFPPCDDFRPKRDLAPPEGLVEPKAGLEISSIRKAGPTVQVLGFLPQRPVAFRREFERRRDVEILFIEDEIFEAEVLLTDGEFRNYMKARIVCDKGSQFVAVIAKEIAGGAVPTPTGTATPG